VLPSVPEMTDHVQTRLKWMEERTGGKHARGTNIIPFSMHNIDEMISDLGLDVGSVTRTKQWLLPISPQSYRKLPGKLRSRHEMAGAAGLSAPTVASARRRGQGVEPAPTPAAKTGDHQPVVVYSGPDRR